MLAEMVHFIDLALWLTPSVPVEIYAAGSPRGNFVQVLHFADGSLANLHHTMVGHFDYSKELFEATVGHVTVALDHHLELRQQGLAGEATRVTFPLHGALDGIAGDNSIAGYFAAVAAARARRVEAFDPAPRFSGPDKGHRRHLERFARHIRGEGDNPCPVASAIALTRIALKSLDSVRTGQPVRIDAADVVRPATEIGAVARPDHARQTEGLFAR